ncbi:MBOAT family O-acyltransferase [Sulfurospirillum arcachonense]|uniref:MBOAT family O-acyltransferase n=1 Tax=Sulfurospirillum arcachonense TaxID=57666 RepID=UPI000468A27F|nr:MBOAT family O-acyltransferase [Sulfurospirillum arcachonense]
MIFNSYEFIFVFLPFTFYVYFYLNSKRLTEASKSFLVFTSLFFYSWWNILYLPLILSSLLFNYVIGKSLNIKSEQKKINKKSILTIGIVANLFLLGYFKYFDFFIFNVNFIMGSNITFIKLALPLAISFFTFQQIAYLVDSYRFETKEYDFLNYALFITFFPQLIAGPIVHHKEMMPQFALIRNKAKNYKNIACGLFIFSIGLFKKVVIADIFAIWATTGFDHSISLTLLEAWATSLSYTFQLYFDFSGYTDMAIGTALLFNINLPINFNSPYKAGNIQDFWRRWHITLSRFLRDYVYIPLGGNRAGKSRVYYNLMATFILGGLWHGAGWTFIFWGTLHGIALVIHRLWKNFGFTMNKYLSWFITFNFVNIAWVFFRANGLSDAIKVLNGMVGKNGIDMINPIWILAIILGFIIVFFFRNSNYNLVRFVYSKMMIFYVSFLLVCSFVAMRLLGGQSEFLYFNF